MWLSSSIYMDTLSLLAGLLQQDGITSDGVSWTWVAIVGLPALGTIAGLFLSETLRIGKIVDRQISDLEKAHAKELAAKDVLLTEKNTQLANQRTDSATQLTAANAANATLIAALKEQFSARIEREVGSSTKWETFAESLLEDLDTLNDNLGLSVRLNALGGGEKGEK